MSFLERFHERSPELILEREELIEKVLNRIEERRLPADRLTDRELLELDWVSVPDPRDEGDNPRTIEVCPTLQFGPHFRILHLEGKTLYGTEEKIGQVMGSDEGLREVAVYYTQREVMSFLDHSHPDFKYFLTLAKSVLDATEAQTEI